MSPARRLVRVVLWSLLVLVLVVHLAAGWIFSGQIIEDHFVPSPATLDLDEAEYGYELVSYSSDVGDLDAVLLPASGSRWIIHVHDLNTTPLDAEPIFAALQDAGYPQLSINYRNDQGQPSDPSSYHQHGATEWQDLSGAVDYARGNGAESIILAGYGTGSSHALSYAFRHNFDDIAGLILDSSNIDLGQTIDHEARSTNMPVIGVPMPVTVSWLGKFFASLRIGNNWKSTDYIDKAEQSLRIPVLAFHGTADVTVPADQTMQLQETQPQLVRAVFVEGAGHLATFEVDLNGYLGEVLTFLSTVG